MNLHHRPIPKAAAWAAALVLVLPAALGAQSAKAPSFLTGKVTVVEASGRPLAARMDEARRSARGADAFFTAHMIPSWARVHHRGDLSGAGPFSVQAGADKIRIQEKARAKSDGTSVESEREAAPAALLLLHDGRKAGEVRDVSLLDLEEVYDFADAPVFWLGQAETGESLAVVEAAYRASTGESVRKSLLFAAACHTGPRPAAFLKSVALGTDGPKLREQAVFWLANRAGASAVSDLKEIYGREKDLGVKKQVIFALQMTKAEGGIQEIIRIAKTEPQPELRKQAVFWLGQKASAESIKTLKDIVQAPDEETKLKEQAVFALSQLPKEKAVPALIDIARTNKNPEVRKKAMFWLGQSGDPAALALFEEILLKK